MTQWGRFEPQAWSGAFWESQSHSGLLDNMKWEFKEGLDIMTSNVFSISKILKFNKKTENYSNTGLKWNTVYKTMMNNSLHRE